MDSNVCDLFTTQRTTILSFSYPQLNTFRVKYVLFVTMQVGYKVVSIEVTPTYWALLPQTCFAYRSIFELLRMLRLFPFKFGSVEGGENFGHRQRHRDYSPKKTLHKLFLLIFNLLSVLRIKTNIASPKIWIIFLLTFLISLSHKAHPSSHDGFNQAKALKKDHQRYNVIKDAEVAENGNNLENHV